MLEMLELDAAAECDRIAAFIRAASERSGRSMAVLGLSGGIDSALVAALSARALGPENVRVLLMPYCTSNPSSEADARLVIDDLGIRWSRFDITAAVDAFCARDPGASDRRRGNLMARCRMAALYDLAASCDGLVLGTSNRTETLLGYFTLHGDAAADIKPIAHLFKCQVRALARYLGLPDVVIDKAPSADLWAGQTDEGELGFTYDEADQILWLLTEANEPVPAIAARGFAPAVVEGVWTRMQAMAYKLAPVPSLLGG